MDEVHLRPKVAIDLRSILSRREKVHTALSRAWQRKNTATFEGLGSNFAPQLLQFSQYLLFGRVDVLNLLEKGVHLTLITRPVGLEQVD